MSDVSDLAKRYERDPAFRMMVDQMTIAIRQLHLAPSELREASMFAVYREQMRVSPRTFFIEGEGERRDCIPALDDSRIAQLARPITEWSEEITAEERRSMAVEIQRTRAAKGRL